MNKRGHGEGSIYLRKDGRWCACMTIGPNRRKYLYGQSRREVFKKLIMAQVGQDEPYQGDKRVPQNQQAS